MKGINIKCRIKRLQAFTLVEMLISMLVISTIVLSSAIMITQMSSKKSDLDKNISSCIAGNTASWVDTFTGTTMYWYTDATGATTTPNTGTSCYAAVLDAQYNRGKSIESTVFMADNGTSAQKIMAKKILRAACDLGGQKACDYFINKCTATGSGSAPYCDDTANFLDLTYYMHLSQDTYSSNSGAAYIYNQLSALLQKMPTNLVNEVFYAKSNNQTPDYGQNLSTNVAYLLAKPKVYIQACNNGFSAACTAAHDANYNKSCYQVKTNWTDAPTGTYMLTYNGAATPVATSCTMTSTASSAISGCTTIASINDSYNCSTASPAAATNCSNDCFVAYTNNYNRSCSQISLAWARFPNGTHRLTTNGAPPTATVSTTCPVTPDHATCIAGGLGTLCNDGTIYAGLSTDGFSRKLFTTTANQGAFIPWNNAGTTWTVTTATDLKNGNNNYNKLINSTDAASPYYAERLCKGLNDTTAYGYSDWYLPAINELKVLYANRNKKSLTGTFPDDNATYPYWSSTEKANDEASSLYFDSNTTYNYDKNNNYFVRCIRDE